MKNDAQKSKKGRPLKSVGPSIPETEIDRLLVHGEPVEQESGDGAQVRYPSYRELAGRYGVSHTIIARYAKRHNCMQRRKQTRKRVQEIADTHLAEFRAHDLAVSRDDAIRIIDRFMLEFEQALVEGRVRTDNPSDFNLLLRLKGFLLGDADSRQEFLGGITLDSLQARHAQIVRDWESSTSPMRGEVSKELTVGRSEDTDEEGPEV